MFCELDEPLHPGTLRCWARDDGFGLADLWASSGGAHGGLLTGASARLAVQLDTTVARAGSWTSPGLSDPAPLVDGGNHENLGVVPLLRRGFERIVVFVNGNLSVGSSSGEAVEGVDGQIARLFGRPPTSGQYAGLPARVFEEEDFAGLREGLFAAQEAGEMPWHLGPLRVSRLNDFGLEPRTVQVLWMCNEVPRVWADELPDETKNSIGSARGLGTGLVQFPHYSAAFANLSDPLWLTARQVNLLAHVWDHSVRRRAAEFERLLGPDPRTTTLKLETDDADLDP